MSNYHVPNVKCPKCGHTTITAIDHGWRKSIVYSYRCDKCEFETNDYKKLRKKLKNRTITDNEKT